MSELHKMILLDKQGDKFALEKLIEIFNPAINSNVKLIDSYKSINKYDLEDNRQEIILALINAVKVIPLEQDSFKNDGKITNYINKAIQNKRLEFSKKFSRHEKLEYKINLIYVDDLLENESFESEIIIRDLFDKLTKTEKLIMQKRFLSGKSDAEIGNITIFAHGIPGSVEFGYKQPNFSELSFNIFDFKGINSSSFKKDAVTMSYACNGATNIKANSTTDVLPNWAYGKSFASEWNRCGFGKIIAANGQTDYDYIFGKDVDKHVAEKSYKGYVEAGAVEYPKPVEGAKWIEIF